MLSTIRDHIEMIRNDRPTDQRGVLLPLAVLHRQTGYNAKGFKFPTALHVAIDQQSPACFDVMLEMLFTTKKVFITSQLVDKLDDIINSGSETVN